ncbi:MAG TPA: sialidase family protein [Bryobacteraceae bacterium]|nr:sialidase family protein [Bryobacteraceae bacterium]
MIPILIALLTIRVGPVAADAPAREPQMAANGNTVALAFGAGKTIYCSVSHDGGKSFSAPAKVAEAGILPLTRHRGPRIAFAGSAIVITAVTGNKPEEGAHAHGLPSDGDLFVWRSTDGGKTWSAGKAINDVPAAATEGLHALASDGKGTLFAAWLDHRGGKGTKLYGARSTDGGVTWSKNFAVYQSPGGSICECCHPSLAMDGSGRLLVMWRNSLDGSRDMYLASSADGATFSAPRKLGNGTWKLNACPMDGGGLAASGGRIVTAWRRDSDVFLDEPGQAEQRLGTGKDVALALSGGHVYVAWEDGPKLAVWEGGKLEVLAESGTFPSLCALPEGGVLAAWEQNGAIEMRRLP